MKPAAPELIALLATRSFVHADLYTITLFGGGVLRHTTADVDMTYGGETYLSGRPLFDDSGLAARGHWKVGLDVDTWQVRVLPRETHPVTGAAWPDKIGATPWLQAAVGGALDGATVRVDRAYLAAWPTPWRREVAAAATGIVNLFLGRMAEVDLGRGFAVLNVNDYRDLLSVQLPRNRYQAGCRHTLFDARCALDPDNFDVAATVEGGSARGAIIATLPQAAGYFDLGRLAMTSGPNATFGRMVRSWDGTTLKLIAPFPFEVTTGETFTVWPGCDKLKATCDGKFGNLVNFGGQPFIPAPEMAI